MTKRAPRILMCRPNYYGIEYEINPWMDVKRSVDSALAMRQWQSLVEILSELGAQIDCIDPVPRLPDMVFTANAGLVFRDQFVPSHFRHPQRQPETPIFQQWFQAHGYNLLDIYATGNVATAAFEGAGDALFCGETLFAGYLNRSDIAAHRHLASALQCRVVSLELVDPRFYHLDTCFCPLAPGAAIYFPPAFDTYGQAALQAAIPDLIAISETDAAQFGCNAVVVGRNVVTNAPCPQLAAELSARGWNVRQTELSEFLKSGGSAKCLTLRLDGEEAAAWANP